LQQIYARFDTLPREDIRATYDDALEAQQRLFIMRGQLEKLQSDKVHLEKYTKQLKLVLEMLEEGKVQTTSGNRDAFGMVEAIIQAQEAERQRLSRQMHDGPAQALSNFILQTEIAARLFDIDMEKARAELTSLKESATTTFQKVRDFVFELRPMMLDDLGLVPTLKRYVEAFKEQNGIEIRLTVSGVERRLESYIEVMLFRAIQELLGTAARINQANQINVQIEIDDASIKAVIDDNGKAFDVETALESSSMGLKVLKERVEMLGGFLDVESNLGKGSRITFQIPVKAGAQAVFA
jgi:two-component system sensor histidine kinase DegS